VETTDAQRRWVTGAFVPLSFLVVRLSTEYLHPWGVGHRQSQLAEVHDLERRRQQG